MRWRILSIWIIVFSSVVIWNSIDARNTSNARRQDRNDQIAALKEGQYRGCVRGNQRFNKLFVLAIRSAAIAKAKANGTTFGHELAIAKKEAAPYLKVAIIPCKQIIYNIETENHPQPTHPPDKPPGTVTDTGTSPTATTTKGSNK